jgi:hypothetical protein
MRLSAPFSGSILIHAALIYSATAAPGQPALKRDGSNWTEIDQGSFPLPAGGQLRIKAPGSIRVRGTNSAQFTFKLTRSVRAHRESDARTLLRRYPTDAGVQGQSGFIQVGYGPFATQLEISAPRGLALAMVETAGGDLDISDLGGSLVAQASGGKINIGRVGGDIDIRTAGGTIVIGTVGGSARCLSGGGAINATEIRGDAFLETGGGDILLRKAGARVKASTAGGGIQVMEARSTVVANTFGGPIQIGAARGIHCESASGSIVAEFLAGIPVLDSFLSTGSGDITVWIPSNIQISIRAHNEGSGNIQTLISDFPGLRVQTQGAGVFGEVRINGGGPLLQLAGNGGRIYIRRR